MSGFDLRYWRISNSWDQPEAEGNEGTALAIGEEAKVPDADEAGRQQVQEEPAQELVHREGHLSLLVLVSRVPPAEGHLVVGQ